MKIVKILKVTVISVVEFIILLYAFAPIAWVSNYLVEHVIPNKDIFAMDNPYNHMYVILSKVGLYLLIGIILFVIFKIVEVKFISEHTQNSYRYMFIPIILLAAWQVSAIALNLSDHNAWIPFIVLMGATNLIYETMLEKRMKIKTAKK